MGVPLRKAGGDKELYKNKKKSTAKYPTAIKLEGGGCLNGTAVIKKQTFFAASLTDERFNPRVYKALGRWNMTYWASIFQTYICYRRKTEISAGSVLAGPNLAGRKDPGMNTNI